MEGRVKAGWPARLWRVVTDSVVGGRVHQCPLWTVGKPWSGCRSSLRTAVGGMVCCGRGQAESISNVGHATARWGPDCRRPRVLAASGLYSHWFLGWLLCQATDVAVA
jgi:hypothetical protein